LIKRIAATAGQAVCEMRGEVYIDGVFVGSARSRDYAGRPLDAWSGCHVLSNDELFLLSTHASSFDSRYFGPVGVSNVEGRAVPLWIER
jgi:type IV secretory pathway protease TraF